MFLKMSNLCKIRSNPATDNVSLSMSFRVMCLQGPIQLNMQSFAVDRTESRSVIFTEQEAFWTIPLHEISAVVHVAVTKGLAPSTVFIFISCVMQNLESLIPI
jgi:hypothetical protein